MLPALRTALSCVAIAMLGCGTDAATAPPPDAAGVCTDGILDPGEDCEVNASGNFPSGCVACAVCGNGTVGGYEHCDDGNATPGDGCTACLLPGDRLSWNDDVEVGFNALLLPRPGGGVRAVRNSADRVEILTAQVPAAPGTTTSVGYGPFDALVFTAAVNAPDGGVVACGYEQRQTSHGTTTPVVATDRLGNLRWAHTVEDIFGHHRSCSDVVVDAAAGQVLVAVTTYQASGDAGFPGSRLLRLDLATGRLISDTLLSGWSEDGAIGKQMNVTKLLVLDDSTVVVSGLSWNEPRLLFLAALGSDGALRWRIVPSQYVVELASAGDRIVLAGDDGVDQLRATDGSLASSWSFGRKAAWIAMNATTVVIMGVHDDGTYAPFASWSIDGEPRYDVQYALGNGGSFLRLALSDDGVAYTIAEEGAQRRRLWALSP
jgi:cysteine-rich repeat protein